MFNFSDSDFWLPTPKGVYEFIKQAGETPYSRLVSYLFSTNKTITLHQSGLAEKLGIETQDLQSFFEYIERQNWVNKYSERIDLPKTSIDELLSQLVSANGNVLLTDRQGFTLGNTRFSESSLDLLSGMSTEIIEVYQRYQSIISEKDIFAPAWGIINEHGLCELGVWQLHVAQNNFILMIEGKPNLGTFDFVALIWMLHYRYQQR